MFRFVERIRNRKPDERGAEIAAMLFVLPVLLVLVIGLIDIGFALRTRMLVENAARDGARGVAADGGNLNPRTNSNGVAWNNRVRNQLWNGSCTMSNCSGAPTVTCTPEVVNRSGDMVSCTIVYSYRGLNADLLNSPMGLGMGSFIKPFTVTSSARAEVGRTG